MMEKNTSKMVYDAFDFIEEKQKNLDWKFLRKHSNVQPSLRLEAEELVVQHIRFQLKLDLKEELHLL
jgi:hypothetical protein